MQTVKVYYADGNTVITGINGTDEEVRAYYVGKTFNLGDGAGGDRMVRAVCVDFIDKPIDERRRLALATILKAMNENDATEGKTNPWVPGVDCKALKNLVIDMLAW